MIKSLIHEQNIIIGKQAVTIEQLIGVLKEYGHHHTYCLVVQAKYSDNCTCGLKKILDDIKGE